MHLNLNFTIPLTEPTNLTELERDLSHFDIALWSKHEGICITQTEDSSKFVFCTPMTILPVYSKNYGVKTRGMKTNTYTHK